MSPRTKSFGAFALFIVVALTVSACGGGSDDGEAATSSNSASADTTTAPTSLPTESAPESSQTETTPAPETGELSEAVQAAIEANAARQALQTEWTGPTDGPPAEPGKTVVYISSDQQNAAAAAWGEAQVEAAEQIDWEVVVLDGKGTTEGRLTACNQALALNPDGITLEGDAAGMQDCLEIAAEQGIPVVAIHGAGFPGPVEELNLFTNITSDPTEIGIALADFVIADSQGTGKAMILYDALFDVARAKAEGMRDEFALCETCELLGYENSPLAEVETRTPQLFSTYVQQYGDDFQYVMTIADYYYDFAVPALEAGGVPPDAVKLVGSDGTPQAYERIRNGQYQVATVPEPVHLQGYQTIDEINRALNGEPPSGYVPPIYVVTADNIDQEGGDQGQFIPSNGYVDHYLSIWRGE